MVFRPTGGLGAASTLRAYACHSLGPSTIPPRYVTRARVTMVAAPTRQATTSRSPPRPTSGKPPTRQPTLSSSAEVFILTVASGGLGIHMNATPMPSPKRPFAASLPRLCSTGQAPSTPTSDQHHSKYKRSSFSSARVVTLGLDTCSRRGSTTGRPGPPAFALQTPHRRRRAAVNSGAYAVHPLVPI